MIAVSLFKSVLDALPYPVFIKNSKHEWVYGNPEFAKLINRDDFLGKTDSDIFPENQVEAFWREDNAVLKGEQSLNEEEVGEGNYALTHKLPIQLEDGEHGLIAIVLAMASGDDLTSNVRNRYEKRLRETAKLVEQLKSELTTKNAALKQKLMHRELELTRAIEIAHTDTATGLRNRLGFEQDLADAVQAYEDSGKVFGLALLDIDHFKRINDRFGHDMGDKVLQTVGQRLRKLPHIRSVARIGGDEFAIITDRPSIKIRDRQADLEQAQAYVFRPLVDGSSVVNLSGSVGFCVFPDHAKDTSQLKRRADLALLDAKARGRSRLKIFDEALGRAADRRRMIEEELPLAIAEGAIDVVFQPIVSSTTRSTCGVEALARWCHPQLGVVQPQEFVDIANDMGLTSQLDAAVFVKAARAMREFLLDGRISYVSFNVSPNDIIDPNFASDLLTRIKQSGIQPGHVFLEVIENSIVHDIHAASENLRELGAAGVKSALDDYGTGFSNLRALLDLPINRLKVDRSLVASLEDNVRMLDLFVSIMQLAQGMGVDVVAEGIETSKQALFVEAAGCEYMQGFLFGRGVSVLELEEMLYSEEDSGQASARVA